MKLLEYKNGNTNVTLMSDGTKIREYNDTPIIDFPESIDVKITNFCDMNCMYCHESSTNKGIHSDLNKLLEVLKELPAGVELAIGGGNPLSHPDLIIFLQALKKQGIIANITINQGHLKPYQDLIIYLIENDLVKGVGISIVNNNFTYIKKLKEITSNIVYHIIAGVNTVNIMDKLIELGNCKVLVLGYKKFGFGIIYHNQKIDLEISKWYRELPKYLGKCVISFDNLAIEQLNVRRLFTDKGWDNFYMGDDFCYTMYIDAVKQEYAPTSRNNNRKSFNEFTLINYFQTNKK